MRIPHAYIKIITTDNVRYVDENNSIKKNDRYVIIIGILNKSAIYIFKRLIIGYHIKGVHLKINDFMCVDCVPTKSSIFRGAFAYMIL